MYRWKSVLGLGLCAGACGFAQPAPAPPPFAATQLTLFTGTGARLLGGEFNVEGRVVKGAPFSAQITTSSTQTLADGNRIVTNNTSFMARDSEGRTRREQTIKAVGEWATGQNPPAMVFIHDPVAQVSYAMEPNTHNARRTSLASGAAAAIEAAMKKKHEAEAAAHGGSVSGGTTAIVGIAPETAMAQKLASEDMKRNVATESLGSKVIEGVQAEGKRTTRTIPAGQIGNEKPIVIVDEIWTSSELNATVMSRHSDPQTGEMVYAMTNIQRSEPDAALFVVPVDYTVLDGPARFTFQLPKH